MPHTTPWLKAISLHYLPKLGVFQASQTALSQVTLKAPTRTLKCINHGLTGPKTITNPILASAVILVVADVAGCQQCSEIF